MLIDFLLSTFHQFVFLDELEVLRVDKFLIEAHVLAFLCAHREDFHISYGLLVQVLSLMNDVVELHVQKCLALVHFPEVELILEIK